MPFSFVTAASGIIPVLAQDFLLRP